MAINAPSGTWTTGTWPWPQVFFGSYYTIGIAVNSTNLHLYELYCDTSDVWQATSIVSLGTLANIDYVSFADFGTFYALCTYGVTSDIVYVDGVYRNPGSGAPLTTALPTTQVPAFGCCCNFNGQAIIGCIAHGDDASFGDMGYNSVAWSEIGSFDFELHKSARQAEGIFTAGYRNMDWGESRKGRIYTIRKLGNSVIVLGEGGIARMTPKVVKDTFTYEMVNVEGIGIPHGGCVSGDDNICGFVDNNNEFWIVDKNFTFKNLGYQEWMENLTTADIKVSYVSGRKRFFISDSATGYGLNEQGLYETNQLVTSAGIYRGNLCGFWVDSADYEWRIETDILSFGQRSLKSLGFMEVSGNYVKGSNLIQTSLKYKYDINSATFAQTDWKNTSPQGISYPMVTASEFKMLVKGADYRDATLKIDQIAARVKRSDKRSIRGLHVNKASTQTGQ